MSSLSKRGHGLPAKRVVLTYSHRDQGFGAEYDVQHFMFGNNPGSQWTPSVAESHRMNSPTFTASSQHSDSPARSCSRHSHGGCNCKKKES